VYIGCVIKTEKGNVKMIIKQIEYHQMTSTLTYDIDDDAIIDAFGTIENFETSMADEDDDFFEFMAEGWDYDREDDIWTDRKGGYDVDYEIEYDGEDD
jgi:hypothetical protein